MQASNNHMSLVIKSDHRWHLPLQHCLSSGSTTGEPLPLQYFILFLIEDWPMTRHVTYSSIFSIHPTEKDVWQIQFGYVFCPLWFVESRCLQATLHSARLDAPPAGWMKPSSQPSAAKQTRTIPPVGSHILTDRLSRHFLNKPMHWYILQHLVK